MIDAKDGDKKTPLHLALEGGMYSKVEALLEEFNAGKYSGGLHEEIHKNSGQNQCRSFGL